MGYCSKCVDKYSGYFYLVFRVLIGVLFFMHGWMKFSGSNPAAFGSLFWFAGAIEVVAGVLLVLGLFSRLVATVTAIEMIVAWFVAHVSRGWNPLANGGEAAVLFLAAFLVVIVYGNGKLSLEPKLWKKELF